MKAVTIILLATLTLLTAACGKDDGIPATFHEKAEPTPPTMEQKAMGILSDNMGAASQSSSSNHIRANLLGVDMVFSQNTGSSTKVAIKLSETYGSSDCATRNFSGEFDNSDALTMQEIPDLGHMICLDKNCGFVMIIIEHSANQMSTSKGAIAAAVPVILKDTSGNKALSSGVFKPTASEDSAFMRFSDDTNITCNAAAESKNYSGPILPDDYSDEQDFTYFPTNDYSTWF